MYMQYPIRINKYLAQIVDFSRREADEAIKSGRVKINEKIAELGEEIKRGDKILLDNKPLLAKKYVYLAYNKPAGIVSSGAHRGQKSIANILDYPERVHPVGRLDKDSSGLIILTNDPRLTEKLTGPKNKTEKEYEVVVSKPIIRDFLNKMRSGIVIKTDSGEYKTKKTRVKKLEPKKFSIILTEGKKRQIRLMCRALSYHVKELKRVRIGNIHLEGLAKGKWRELEKMI